MSEININRLVGDIAAPDNAPKWPQNKNDTAFADVLRQVGAASQPAACRPGARPVDELTQRWQSDFRQWRAESAELPPAERAIYCGRRAAEWLAGLMDAEPAVFREWLTREQWHLAESGLDNAILPTGFSADEMSRWLADDLWDM